MSNTLSAANLSASLTVKDVERSATWYCDVVGFVVEQKMEREGRIAAIRVRAGDVRILLNQDNGGRGWERAKGEGFSLMITTAQDIDQLAQGIKSAGGTLETEPADMPWGARVFRVTDPDGFKFAISSIVNR